MSSLSKWKFVPPSNSILQVSVALITFKAMILHSCKWNDIFKVYTIAVVSMIMSSVVFVDHKQAMLP